MSMNPRDFGLVLWPRLKWSGGGHYRKVTVPLWLLPAAWAIHWPLLMRRRDLKEQSRFTGS